MNEVASEGGDLASHTIPDAADLPSYARQDRHWNVWFYLGLKPERNESVQCDSAQSTRG